MQSKFLEGVEAHTPEKDIDLFTKAKRELQKTLLSADIHCDAKTFEDEVVVRLNDGTSVKLEIKEVIPVEDGELEHMEDMGLALTAAKEITGASKARGGMNPFDNPQKKVEKAIGNVYKKVADKLNTVTNSLK